MGRARVLEGKGHSYRISFGCEFEPVFVYAFLAEQIGCTGNADEPDLGCWKEVSTFGAAKVCPIVFDWMICCHRRSTFMEWRIRGGLSIKYYTTGKGTLM
jgi:hypothetical protein